MAKMKEAEGTVEAEEEFVEKERLELPCCPSLEEERACDVIDFHYRLPHSATVHFDDRPHRVPVEVLLHIRLERCPGPLALGDLVYSTTLLPGEKVRLFTMDRRTRFTFDSATRVSYRREQTSEERFYMSAMSDFMSDVTVRDEARAGSRRMGSYEDHVDTSGVLATVFSGASVDVWGEYDAESTSEFVRELRQHAEASHNRSVEATRTASSVSVGEVQARTHAEAESEDHFESSSRAFSNPNRCHAVTFLFHQINKTQTVRLTLESIRRRVVDPAADTRVTNRPFTSRGEVSVIPSAVLATDRERLEVERIGRSSAAAQVNEAVRLSPSEARGATLSMAAPSTMSLAAVHAVTPLPPRIRAEALRAVDDDLIRVGLLDKATQEVSKEIRERFSLEVTTSVPTPGLLVRGCLDRCNICEPTLRRDIALDLQRKRLENEMLRRQIELLEKSQEYRCCPAGSQPEEEAGTG